MPTPAMSHTMLMGSVQKKTPVRLGMASQKLTASPATAKTGMRKCRNQLNWPRFTRNQYQKTPTAPAA